MPKPKLSVVISSTARDLPKHREQVMAACLRQGMFPIMMEHLPASPDDAIAASLKRVDEADIYVGIYAYRYGYVPEGHDISVTEMEYNHAGERGIPRLLYVMHEDHPVRPRDVETGPGAAKLAAFKDRLLADQVVNFFQSPADLRAQVIDALSGYRVSNLTAFHTVRDIPAPPEPYIAHPYTLLQTPNLIGRQDELNLLTDWVARPDSDVYQARILNVVAIDGQGKSALCWQWFNKVAPLEMSPLAGRLWWSFYESDAQYENFIARALAYVSGRPRQETEEIPLYDAERQLLDFLDRQPFLLVLDGLERIPVAYARLDAVCLVDNDRNRRTANRLASALSLPPLAADTLTGQSRRRKTADPRAGMFLRKLIHVRSARILISTRLYPADLQAVTKEPLPGCYALFLPGLSDDDALALWRAFGVKGSRDALLPLFRTFENHPLLIQALAGEVARCRPAPGDYDRWRAANPDFNPFDPSLIRTKAHVLVYALRGLDEAQHQVLRTVAGLHMAATYDTLTAVLVGSRRPFSEEEALDRVLSELEGRGLMGWDRYANRYDLHPIVRGVIWGELEDDTGEEVYQTLQAHFEPLSTIEDWRQVKSLEDMTPVIELYGTLIGREHYSSAFVVFRRRLSDAMLYRLSANRRRAELLQALFPDGLDELPRLHQRRRQAYILNALALAYQYSGQPGRAVPIYRRHVAVHTRDGNMDGAGTGLCNLALALRVSGALRDSEGSALQSLSTLKALRRRPFRRPEWEYRHREAAGLHCLGLALASRGAVVDSTMALQRSLRIFKRHPHTQAQGFVTASHAQQALWLADSTTARLLADEAWKLAHPWRHELDFVYAARLQGMAALKENDLQTAGERLHHALTRARAVDLVEEELQTLVALAELRRKQGSSASARDLLDDVWEPAECGPYPLFHADAFNVLAQIERDTGNREAAVEAATRAYRLAWCDGPPYAYHWGLEAARVHLAALGAPEPDDLPPFDESQHEPMPEVEINPRDEFYVE